MGESSRKVSQRKLLCVVSPVSGVFSDRQRYKMIQLCSNQVEPIEKAISFFQSKKPKPSLIVLPTAWGKSILTAFVAKNTNDKMIVLQPSKELLEQNYLKYVNLCDGFANAGIYSASFGSKEIAQITYATIGSIKTLGAKFKALGFTKMLIDEAHLFPREDTQAIDAQAAQPIQVMPFGKYKGEKISNIPLDYRKWMIRAFEWNSRNVKLKKSIMATL